MKKQVLLFVLGIGMVMNPIIGQKNYRQLYERKIHTYTKMNTCGWVMILTGGGMALGGGILLATLSDNPGVNTGSGNSNEDLKASEGSFLITVGIGMVAGGLVFKSIGSRKALYYKNKLKNLSMGVIYGPDKRGLMLTYRF
jgi:hypothetical protein